jgi:predicted outer membrane repeat protein
VYFFNNTVGNPTNGQAMCGGPLYVKYSNLNVNAEARVHFVNNTADCGGAIFLRTTSMSIASKVTMYFLENMTRKLRHVKSYIYKFGGAAILLDDSSLNTGTNVTLHFSRNSVGLDGGAILMVYKSKMRLSSSILVDFTSNIAEGSGGAIAMHAQSSICITNDAVFHFRNNRALADGGAIVLFEGSVFNASANTSIYFHNNTAINKGGALSVESGYLFIQKSTIFIENNSASKLAGGGIFMSASSLKICEHSDMVFTANQAPLQGGAVYMSLGGNISIDFSSKLKITHNSASQGGALYLTASATLYVGNNSVVSFGYNTASDRGGAVYANVGLSLPCFLALTSYSSTVNYEGNVAKHGIGMDVYGASIRSNTCSENSKKIGTLPYCGTDKANITIIPRDHISSLSSVSSGPKRVCLCDSNGNPQCANISEIFVNGLTFYSGEPFNLSLVVVGHDFGVSVGTVVANFIHCTGHSRSKLNHNQYHQWLSNAQCSNITYSIISINLYEILFLQTIDLDVVSTDQHMIDSLIDKYNLN